MFFILKYISLRVNKIFVNVKRTYCVLFCVLFFKSFTELFCLNNEVLIITLMLQHLHYKSGINVKTVMSCISVLFFRIKKLIHLFTGYKWSSSFNQFKGLSSGIVLASDWIKELFHSPPVNKCFIILILWISI